MADIVAPEVRSRIMSKIKNENTRPEKIVRSLIHGHGLRFRLHSKMLPGKPDLVFRRYRAVLFVHGCFWHLHRCSLSGIPASNRAFWKEKLIANRKRDGRVKKLLKSMGWRVIDVWECLSLIHI